MRRYSEEAPQGTQYLLRRNRNVGRIGRARDENIENNRRFDTLRFMTRHE
jgi:hypothetical protein